MRIYRCKAFYMSGLADEPVPRWPQDYEPVAEMDQQGTGKEALDAAFSQSAGKMNVGDVVGLDDGTRWRCEMDSWTDIGKTWEVRVQNNRGRAK